jgi:hypothetical protein
MLVFRTFAFAQDKSKLKDLEIAFVAVTANQMILTLPE